MADQNFSQIILKHGEEEAWKSADPTLAKGEAGVVSKIDITENDTTGKSVLIIGDGLKTFNELRTIKETQSTTDIQLKTNLWANAIDVADWAKADKNPSYTKEENDKTFKNYYTKTDIDNKGYQTGNDIKTLIDFTNNSTPVLIDLRNYCTDNFIPNNTHDQVWAYVKNGFITISADRRCPAGDKPWNKNEYTTIMNLPEKWAPRYLQSGAYIHFSVGLLTAVNPVGGRISRTGVVQLRQATEVANFLATFSITYPIIKKEGDE